jgi:nucleotide-binding universal stress UspA family protein
MSVESHSVLVATDLSARSDRAVDRAVTLAQQWGTTPIVAHVFGDASRLAKNVVKAQAAVREVLPAQDTAADILLLKGPAPKAIVEAARDEHCSVIVTGVARFNHVGDFITGTAVDHIVRNATVPVLVVKRRPRAPYRTIVVATDFSSCSRFALLSAARLFPQAAIHLVHAYHVPYEGWLDTEDMRQDAGEGAGRDLAAFLADPAIPAQVRDRVVSHHDLGEAPAVVGSVASAVSADLVVVGAHGRSGFVKAIIGSIAESLLFRVQPDTLMVREIL